jgi:hypothetical protein
LKAKHLTIAILFNVTTINILIFSYDSRKDKSNVLKHGISLLQAPKLNWDEQISWLDKRKDYGELRIIGLVPMDNRLYCIVYVDLPSSRRIISLRKANNRETDRYEKETT